MKKTIAKMDQLDNTAKELGNEATRFAELTQQLKVAMQEREKIKLNALSDIMKLIDKEVKEKYDPINFVSTLDETKLDELEAAIKQRRIKLQEDKQFMEGLEKTVDILKRAAEVVQESDRLFNKPDDSESTETN